LDENLVTPHFLVPGEDVAGVAFAPRLTEVKNLSCKGATMNHPVNKEPYQQAYYPPMPTGFTRMMRTNVLWQAIRFVVINLKMLRLMRKSH
jgi:hypothetical protein